MSTQELVLKLVRLALKNKDAEELEIEGEKFTWAEAMQAVVRSALFFN